MSRSNAGSEPQHQTCGPAALFAEVVIEPMALGQ